MLSDLDDCLSEDLIFLGLLPAFSSSFGLLSRDFLGVLGLDRREVLGLKLSDLFGTLLGLDLLDWFGLDFLEWLGVFLREWLGVGSVVFASFFLFNEFCFLGLLSCFWGDLFGDLVLAGWISAFIVWTFDGCLPSSSICIGWKVSGGCEDWINLAWLPVLPADSVEVVLKMLV